MQSLNPVILDLSQPNRSFYHLGSQMLLPRTPERRTDFQRAGQRERPGEKEEKTGLAKMNNGAINLEISDRFCTCAGPEKLQPRCIHSSHEFVMGSWRDIAVIHPTSGKQLQNCDAIGLAIIFFWTCVAKHGWHTEDWLFHSGQLFWRVGLRM